MSASRRGAFGDLATADVLLNMQHDRGRPLARTGGQGGLTLTDSVTTLRAVVDLPPTRDGLDVAELLRRGVLAGFSLEFRVEAEGERFGCGGSRCFARQASWFGFG